MEVKLSVEKNVRRKRLAELVNFFFKEGAKIISCWGGGWRIRRRVEQGSWHVIELVGLTYRWFYLKMTSWQQSHQRTTLIDKSGMKGDRHQVVVASMFCQLPLILCGCIAAHWTTKELGKKTLLVWKIRKIGLPVMKTVRREKHSQHI